MIIIQDILLGSLFDGIGGFPYAASLYGIKTLWASEIIPAAISITRRHFPDMEHVGDITKLNGAKLTPVDIITCGSPCQSFSIAGGRDGLEGKSGLFWEAIRIIREMRIATNEQYPRYCIFENVPGILSSSRGSDFKTVLQAFTETEISMPPFGKWSNAGMVRGARVDFAWVIKDARHFGVSQRRRRLFAVADFRGQRAAEILFKQKSLHWYFAQGGATREGIAANAPGGAGGTSGATHVVTVLNDQGGKSFTVEKTEISPTLRSEMHGNTPIVSMKEGTAAKVYGICSANSNSMKSANPRSGIYEAETARTIDRNCGNPGCQQGGMAILSPIRKDSEKQIADPNPAICGTLCAKSIAPNGIGNEADMCILQSSTNPKYIVRRLTPGECELLQGYPKGYTAYGHDGKPICDTARYQALGNSICVPCVAYVISGIVDEINGESGGGPYQRDKEKI